MKRIIPLLALLLTLACCNPVQNKVQLTNVQGKDDGTLTFMFYNVENLYDVNHDPGTEDQEFLPGGKKQWNTQKYHKKINDLSKVIKELGDKELPDLVGMAEVENDEVLKDLVSNSNLTDGHYEIVHFEEGDSRGIDQALIYRPSKFTVISKKLIPVRSSKGGFYARGILYVTGKSNDGEVFHVFVNHWPSRENSKMLKETGREEMAAALRRLTDILLSRDRNCNIVIMGDMNDEPDSESLAKVLGAGSPGQQPQSGLINLMIPAFKNGEGTVKFRNIWKMLDNLVVSESLLNGNGYHVDNKKGRVFHTSWMEFHKKNGDFSPDRTYAGDKYTGGPSDHFPVYFRLVR